MSLNIQIVDHKSKSRDMLEKKFIEKGYEVEVSEQGIDSVEVFHRYVPQMVLMNFSDETVASQSTREMIEFDHTACVFGIAPIVDEKIKDVAFKSGVRAIIQSNCLMDGSESVEEILSMITSACDELKIDRCTKCWETDSFVNLKIINS